jgi:hypothetical protein
MKFETVMHPFMLLMKLRTKPPLLNIRIGNTRDNEKMLTIPVFWNNRPCPLPQPSVQLTFEFSAQCASPQSQGSPARSNWGHF